MYSFNCGEGFNNESSKVIVNKEENREKINKLKSIINSQEKIAHMIFNEIDGSNENLATNLGVILTISDELNIPIRKSIANILYFALCINSSNNKNQSHTVTKIHTYSQANTLYQLYEGDCNKVFELNENDERKFRFTTIKTWHPILFPGFNLEWKIPVGFYRVENKETGKMESKVTLSGIAYCELVISNCDNSNNNGGDDSNANIYRIPRKIYTKFFKDHLERGRLICSSTDDIKSFFNIYSKESNEALFEALDLIGYRRQKQLISIPLPGDSNIQDPRSSINHLNRYLFLEDGKIKCIINSPIGENDFNSGYSDVRSTDFENRNKFITLDEDSREIYWKEIQPNKLYILLPNYDYIPLNNSGQEEISLLGK